MPAPAATVMTCVDATVPLCKPVERPKRTRQLHNALPMIQMPRRPSIRDPDEPKQHHAEHPQQEQHSGSRPDPIPPPAKAVPPQQMLDDLLKALVIAADDTIGRVKKKDAHIKQDDILRQLSSQQQQLRVRIHNELDQEKRQRLRSQRMLLMRSIHRRALTCASTYIDALTKEVQEAKDNAQFFLATKQLRTWKRPRLIVHDEQGREVKQDKEKAKIIAEHFRQVFQGGHNKQTLTPFAGPPRALIMPISTPETTDAIKKLKNRRAVGYDQIPAELMKASSFAAQALTMIYNQAFEQHSPIQVGHGILIPFPKPGKSPGPCKSLRPITLLTTVRKILSLVVVARTRPRFEARLPPGQAGARQGRSTADGVWTQRMLIAMVTHYHVDVHDLGTDIAQAFDSVDRLHLLEFFEQEGWMDEDECRMTRLLMTDTTLQVRVGATLSSTFQSFLGTLQGDALSTMIFIGYLAGAMKNVKKQIKRPLPPEDALLQLPLETVYVDDADFFSTSQDYLEQVLAATDASFVQWNLKLNISKTERTKLTCAETKSTCPCCGKFCKVNATCCDCCDKWWHNECAHISHTQFQEFVKDPMLHWECPTCLSGGMSKSRGTEAWRNKKHLGTMLDSTKDVAKRIQSAHFAFATLNKIWFRREMVKENKRLQLFKAFVLPHFVYNLCAQALTKPLERRLDAAHRKLLRRVIGVFFPNRISNDALYERTASQPISKMARNARWRFLGHVLRRRKEQHPAAMATYAFFRAGLKFAHRRNAPHNTIIDTLRADLLASVHCHGLELKTFDDLEVLSELADDRKQWDGLVAEVCMD